MQIYDRSFRCEGVVRDRAFLFSFDVCFANFEFQWFLKSFQRNSAEMQAGESQSLAATRYLDDRPVFPEARQLDIHGETIAKPEPSSVRTDEQLKLSTEEDIGASEIAHLSNSRSE